MTWSNDGISFTLNFSRSEGCCKWGMCRPPVADGHLNTHSWGQSSSSFHLWALLAACLVPSRSGDARTSLLVFQTSVFPSPVTHFRCSQLLVALSSRAERASSHAGRSLPSGLPENPSHPRGLSFLDGVLNSPERRVSRESCLRRPPDGQQHAWGEPDRVLLHLQSMTRASGWKVFSNDNKVMTEGRKTVNDEFLPSTNASWWSSPRSSEQASARTDRKENSRHERFPLAHRCL